MAFFTCCFALLQCNYAIRSVRVHDDRHTTDIISEMEQDALVVGNKYHKLWVINDDAISDFLEGVQNTVTQERLEAKPESSCMWFLHVSFCYASDSTLVN